MLLRDKIIHLMSDPDYVPLREPEIATALKLDKKGAEALEDEIKTLLKRGAVVRIKKNRICLPQDANLVSGRIRFRQSGAAILIRDADPKSPAGESIKIAAEDTWVAMHNDRVLIRMTDGPRYRRSSSRKPGKKNEPAEKYGRVIRILERARTVLTGSLQKTNLFYYVVPDDPRLVQDIYVSDPAKSSLKPRPKINDKVVVSLFEWEQRHVNPEGEITEVLGKTHEPGAELTAIFRKYDLNPDFPPAIENETKKIPDEVTQKDLGGRMDLRQLFSFTIDPDDSQDFDDALSIELLPGGKRRVGVHIADVGAYVKPGTALDEEAKKRGNSTYLVGTVVPMLPHKLSNGLCSLREGEDRLTKTVLLTFSKDNRLIKKTFANSVIRSRKRLTYRQAYAFLKGDDLKKIRKLPLPPAHQTGATGRALHTLNDEELKKLQAAIGQLWDLAKHLRKKRMNKGSLELDVPEVKIFVDKKGFADRMERIENDESHQLIEEWMLMANDVVAKALTDNKLPAIYRVHDKPDEEKLAELREYLATFGIKSGDLNNRSQVTATLRKIREHPQSYTLRIAFLRSLKRACYMAHPHGHYGLAKTNYTHFTSPIRRYADFVIHRIFETLLTKHLGEKPLPGPKRQYSQAQLESLGEHLSITEQNSTEAERDHVKLKLLEFFDRELAKTEKTRFTAVISDIMNHGMFIELTESQAFGLVHISTLTDDLYVINSSRTELIGRRKKKRFFIGQKIEVVTERVDRFKRQIDFRVADMKNGR